MIGPTRDDWLKQHPYLEPAADLHALVERAADEVPMPRAPVPQWQDYVDEFEGGVPLLRSRSAAIDLTPAGQALTALVDRLSASRLPSALAGQCRALQIDLHAGAEAPGQAVAWLLDRSSPVPPYAGQLQYLGWTVVARYLSDVVAAFHAWRDEERWFRNYCPTCGTLPSMAQLVGTDPGRMRFLSCGHCRTRWRYRRTGCPFCETEDDHRLAAFAVEGESPLRIDYCDACRGYLKTYIGEGREALLLADWTTLHLDVIAGRRDLKRFAASLYEL